MKPYASEGLNEAIAKARLLGARAEEEEYVSDIESEKFSLENALEELTDLREKGLLNAVEYKIGKLRAEERASKHDAQAELNENIATLTAAHQKELIDDDVYRDVKRRLIQKYKGREVEGVELYNDIIITQNDGKFWVEDRTFKSLDTAKAFVDHFRN